MKKLILSSILATFILMLFSCTQPAAKEADVNTESKEMVEESKDVKITIEEVNAAQQAWCDALVLLGKTHEEKGDTKALALKILSEAYDYDNGSVFFKPTLAFGKNTFRNSKEGALAYFIGGDPNFPEDNGFAFKPWVKVRYDNAGENNEGIQIHNDIGISMGNVYLTDKSGKEIMVDKTFVFKKYPDGKLRLIVHKSALPFTPAK
jgi:hypothetical protein